MSKERRLGRGLEALLGRVPGKETPPPPAQGPYGGATEEPYVITPPPGTESPTEPASAPADPSGGAPPPDPHTVPWPSGESEAGVSHGPQRVEVKQIERNPFQPRQNFDSAELHALAESLGAHGLLQPIVVRQVEGRYQLIAGERRLQAAVQVGWTEVPVNVIEADNREMAELAIVENLHRKDLNPLEKAAAFHGYLEEFGCTQEELAARLHIDRSTIANLIRLLELPEAVQQAIRSAKISQGHARALLPLGEEREQIDFCRRIQQDGLNVRQTEALVQQTVAQADETALGVVGSDGKASRVARVQSEHLAALEQELKAALGTNVKITHNARGRGKLVVHFHSHEEFERIRRQITDPGRRDTQIHAG